jgi:hypothetical protein
MGGGLWVLNGALVVQNCTFQSNKAASGAGVSMMGGAPILRNCLVTNNFAKSKVVSGQTTVGAGVLATGGLITDSTIAHNSADSSAWGLGGGVFLVKGASIARTSVYGNSAWSGGGIYSYVGYGMIANVTIDSNHAVTGGGLYAEHSDSLMVVNTIITGNSADTSGGGVLASGESSGGPTLVNCDITHNTTSGVGGGFRNDYRSPNLYNTRVAWNSASASPNISDATGTQTVLTCSCAGDSCPASLVDQGCASHLPADVLDLDGDGDKTEKIPVDASGGPRVKGANVDIGPNENG